MDIREVNGDLLAQDVDAIVNAWNRNIIPWWLLLPQGVSGAIKRQAGTAPFRELAKFGPIPLGEARLTSAGHLDYEAIIHVAGINALWIATEYSIAQSVRSAMAVAESHGFHSLAFPLIGSGSGNRGRAFSKRIMMRTFDDIESPIHVTLVTYDR